MKIYTIWSFSCLRYVTRNVSLQSSSHWSYPITCVLSLSPFWQFSTNYLIPQPSIDEIYVLQTPHSVTVTVTDTDRTSQRSQKRSLKIPKWCPPKYRLRLPYMVMVVNYLKYIIGRIPLGRILQWLTWAARNVNLVLDIQTSEFRPILLLYNNAHR